MSTLTEKDDGLLAQLHNSRTNFEKIWGYRDLKSMGGRFLSGW